jgi:hypothetical protein
LQWFFISLLEGAAAIASFVKTGYTNWHYSISNAIEAIESIPWKYKKHNLTAEDVELIRQLLDTINEFMAKE